MSERMRRIFEVYWRAGLMWGATPTSSEDAAYAWVLNWYLGFEKEGSK